MVTIRCPHCHFEANAPGAHRAWAELHISHHYPECPGIKALARAIVEAQGLAAELAKATAKPVAPRGEFEVGDIVEVRPEESSHYSITTVGVQCIVLEVDMPANSIVIRPLYDKCRAARFDINPNRFRVLIPVPTS